MKILYIDYNMFGKDDIIASFKILGNEVDVVDYPVRYGENTEITKKAIAKELKKYDLVFTTNYYVMISNLCNQVGVRYLSWTYDSPRIALYDRSILNPCNYAFTFDSNEFRSLRSKGVRTVYYMPLGVNSKRISQIKLSNGDKKLFSSEIGFVASLYNEQHNLYDRMSEKLDDYTKGYLEAVIHAQKNLFGGNILEDSIKNIKILSAMYRAMPYDIDKDSFATLEYVYANYFLARKTATMQRMEFIAAISDQYDMKVYTTGDLSKIKNVKNMGPVDYQTEMNKVFKMSKINLNITVPSIQTGIPLRAIDIMGAGGFLLTNYQADFEGLFEPDVDYVYYTSLEDALNKIEYYLTHEEERIQISKNGFRKMAQCFTNDNLIEQMLGVVNNRKIL